MQGQANIIMFRESGNIRIKKNELERGFGSRAPRISLMVRDETYKWGARGGGSLLKKHLKFQLPTALEVAVIVAGGLST